jgi:hypothetical protein
MSKRRRHWWKGPHLSTAAIWMLFIPFSILILRFMV